MRIIYDGPVYDLHLYAPGVNILSGAPKYSETSGANPKILSALIDEPGVWTLVIDHGITSNTFALTPFTIEYETEEGNECDDYCSDK